MPDVNNFCQILFASIPAPGISTVVCPFIECRLATRDPGVVVETAATSQHLSAGVWLLQALVVGLVDKDRLVCPVILAISQLEGAGGCGNFGDILWVSVRC